MNLTDNQLANFYNKIDRSKNDCWNWDGAKDKDGYGFIVIKKLLRAHRLSWVIHNGEIPKGVFVCHHCDNPSCVNPNYLFLGTHQDNMNDMMKKHRHGTEGTKRSRETRNKIAKGRLGKRHSQETKDIISRENTGKERTDEVKLEISKRVSGKGNGMYGRKHSEETKRKMSEKAKERWNNLK